MGSGSLTAGLTFFQASPSSHLRARTQSPASLGSAKKSLSFNRQIPQVSQVRLGQLTQPWSVRLLWPDSGASKVCDFALRLLAVTLLFREPRSGSLYVRLG